MILHDPIPELRGAICTKLVQQKYWHQGQQVEQANVVYLQVDNKQWHRFFIDAGVLFWKIVDRPDNWDTKVEDEHHYPQTDMAEQYGLVGREIESITSKNRGLVSELQVRLSGGIILVLKNECDLTAFAIVSDAELGAV